MMKKVLGLCEAAILVLLGTGVFWFALSEHYRLLMNLKFRWLTVTGAALMLLLGLAALGDLRKRTGYNTVIFSLLLLVILLGKPYLPSAESISLLEPPLQAGLWDRIDQTRFPRKELQDLCTSNAEEIYRSGTSFTTIGVAKRLEALDRHGSFALMTSVMFCCVADAFAVGLRVPYEDWNEIEDGRWVMISGTLAREKTDIPIPNFRFGMAMLSSVDKTYYLQPDKIMSYNRVDQLPLMTEMLGGQTNRLFSRALKESGLWQKLEEDGPFTVFVPVDQAMEILSAPSLDERSEEALMDFVSSHIVPGWFYSRDLMEMESLENLNGQVLRVALENGKIRINESRLLFKDSEACNGVLHYVYPAIESD